MVIVVASLSGFIWPQHQRQLVEHPIDELVAVGAAEVLGQFDGFVEDDAIGRLGKVAEFAGGEQQYAALDVVRPHVNSMPPLRDRNDKPPETVTGTRLGVFEPSPRGPDALLPEQTATPVDRTAHGE